MNGQNDATCLVVPCYNEAARLQGEAFLAFVDAQAGVHLLFVNDGSRDGTLAVLEHLCARRPDVLRVLDKSRNGGKAEAVRDGLNAALSGDTRYDQVGFWDADLATPLEAVPHLLAKLRENKRLEMVFGSRVRLLGRAIHRRPMRHYLGRCFATLASVTLGLPIYDTQCGAKIFRVSTTLGQVLAEPFVSRWIFDVEIIARFLRLKGRAFCCEAIYEFPLHVWSDVGGSKVKASDFFRAVGDLAKIRRRMRERYGVAGTL